MTPNFWTVYIHLEASFLPSFSFHSFFLSHFPSVFATFLMCVIQPFRINRRLQWLSIFSLPLILPCSLSFYTPIDVYRLRIMLIYSTVFLLILSPLPFSFFPSNLSFQVPKEQITVDALHIESSLVMPGIDLEAQAVSQSIWIFLN